MKSSAPVHSLRLSAFFILALATTLCAALPTDEAGVIAYLTGKGVTLTKNAEGHATALKSAGKPPMTADEYALIGKLTQLEEVGINGAPLGDGEWGFLKSLPKLKQLAIWHSAGFASLEPFSGLPVESLTIGGCMGLRDKNKDDAEKLRHAIKTLHSLPTSKRGNWYHSPLIPTIRISRTSPPSFPSWKTCGSTSPHHAARRRASRPKASPCFKNCLCTP